MPVKFRQKVRKWRGRTSHGWGSKKKHRGGGSKGGRGISGRHKHKYSYVVSKEPDHYGRKGFHSPKKRDVAINIADLDRLGKGTEINLGQLGYTKLLSKGHPAKKYKITVAKFTEKAKTKIEKSGGEIVQGE